VLVNRMAKALQELGVGKGDSRGHLYADDPELVRPSGGDAPGGGSTVSSRLCRACLSDRINDAQAKVVITADGNYRGGKLIELKKITDEALQNTPGIEHAWWSAAWVWM